MRVAGGPGLPSSLHDAGRLPYLLADRLATLPDHPLASSTKTPRDKALSLARARGNRATRWRWELSDLQARALGAAHRQRVWRWIRSTCDRRRPDGPESTSEAFRDRTCASCARRRSRTCGRTAASEFTILASTLGELSQGRSARRWSRSTEAAGERRPLLVHRTSSAGAAGPQLARISRPRRSLADQDQLVRGRSSPQGRRTSAWCARRRAPGNPARLAGQVNEALRAHHAGPRRRKLEGEAPPASVPRRQTRRRPAGCARAGVRLALTPCPNPSLAVSPACAGRARADVLRSRRDQQPGHQRRRALGALGKAGELRRRRCADPSRR